jgi:hypothetical protein
MCTLQSHGRKVARDTFANSSNPLSGETDVRSDGNCTCETHCSLPLALGDVGGRHHCMHEFPTCNRQLGISLRALMIAPGAMPDKEIGLSRANGGVTLPGRTQPCVFQPLNNLIYDKPVYSAEHCCQCELAHCVSACMHFMHMWLVTRALVCPDPVWKLT